MRLFGKTEVQSPEWVYMDGVVLTNPNNQAVTVPSTATIVEIGAESAKCYYAVNSAIASAVSPGYVPSETVRTIGPIGNLTALCVHGTSSTVHIQFFREA